jgi:hypothetical protein
MKEKSIIDVAIDTKSMSFLKFIWEQTHRVSDDLRRYQNINATVSIKRKSLVNQSHKTSQQIQNFNGGIQVFTISELVIKFKEKGNMSFINKMITEWANLHQDQELLNTLFNQHCFNQISFIIWRMPSFWSFTEAHFKKVIEYEQLELILHFLQLRDCLTVLNNVQIQKTIVDNYMLYGNKMYYGAEMLVYIYKANWDEKLTKNLCKNIIRTIKTKDILNCHSPILTCLLLCEYLKELGALSIQHKSRCETVVVELIQFCRNIQNANPDENYIRFLMTQKDTRHRSCFQIASENYFYQVLETAEIGTIVKKMWNGNISNNGFFAASSMHRYLDSDIKKMDPFYSFEILDTQKKYFFQLAVWTDSCSMRYWPESLSTVFLIVLYNLFIYFLVKSGQMLNSFNELDEFLKFMLLFYILWITSIILNIFLAVIFSIRTKRKFKFDVWTFYEFVTFIFAILLLVDTKEIFNRGSVNNAIQFMNDLVKNLEIPFGKFLNVQPSSYSGTWAFICRACILAINDILVWLRITGILLTFKEIGPTIRMIYMMGVLLIKYVLIIVLFMACCAAIFTAIFHVHSDQFKDFSTSVMSLFAGFVGSFDTNNFKEDYLMIGSSMIIVYVCVAGILLINLLIALLSNVYEKMSLVVDASHRSVLISYYRRYKWNKSYGYMIFLTTPLSVVNYIVLPLSFCVSKKTLESFNRTVCKFYYTIFYFPFIFVIYIIYSLMVIPFCYIKGIFKTLAAQSMLKISRIIKILNVIKWIGGGLFFLAYVYLRDIYFILATVYVDENGSESTETNRIKSYITPDEVVIFLKFIHKRKSDKPRDIHSLFMDYLEFEQRQKAKNDNILREKKHYLDNLHTAARRTSKKDGKTVVIYNNLKSNITSNYIKKNLIIIEILENFLIDQESDSLSVDLEKLKTLLPMTMNINNAYIKRLIHTDVHALNKAVNKLKLKKNVFLQYQLLNKIVSSAIRLDKLIDHEIMKNLRKKSNKKKAEKDSDRTSDHEEGNDLEYMQELDNMLDNITEDIKDTIEMKKRIDRSGFKDGSVSPSRKMRNTLRESPRDLNTVNTGKEENVITINNSLMNKSKALSAEFNLISTNREGKEHEKIPTHGDDKESPGEREIKLENDKMPDEKNESPESTFNLLKITPNVELVESTPIFLDRQPTESKESAKFNLNNFNSEVSSVVNDLRESQESHLTINTNISNLLEIKNLSPSNTGKFFNSPKINDLQIIYENIQKEDLNTINYEDSHFLDKKRFESITHEPDEKKDEEIILKSKKNNNILNTNQSKKSNLPLLDDQIE